MALPVHLPSPLKLLFIIIVSLQSLRVAWAAAVSPLTDWDAWVNWAGKANLLFLEQRLSPAVFNHPARLPTNLDYPLLLPLTEVWFYSWLGQIHELAVGLIALLFYSALLILFYNAVRPLVSPAAAWGCLAILATVPRLVRPAHSGLADIPLATVVLLAFLLLDYGYNGRSPANLWQSPGWVGRIGFTVGLLPWLKNEGWLWAALLSASWFVSLFLITRQAPLSWKRRLGLSTIFAGLALGVPLLWQLFLGINGTVRFTFMPLTLPNLVSHIDRWPVIIIEMGKRMLTPYWNFIWLLVGLGLVGQITRIIFDKRDWRAILIRGWLIIPVIGYLFLISLTFIFSRFDPYLAQVNNSVERLILQATPIALWWLVQQAADWGWLPGPADSSRD